MDIQEAQRMHQRLSAEVERWRGEFWHAHGDSQGEDWQTILTKVERLQRELLVLQTIVDRRLTVEESVVYGD
jgi:hypothetical protein